MLKAKFYNDFKGCENCILIIGDLESYKRASQYFGKQKGVLITDYEDLSVTLPDEIKISDLFLTPDECFSFSEICKKLSAEQLPLHDYFSVKKAPDIEFLISCGEYKFLP